jgi:hypothetical protein
MLFMLVLLFEFQITSTGARTMPTTHRKIMTHFAFWEKAGGAAGAFTTWGWFTTGYKL